jgi:hypothetical protein
MEYAPIEPFQGETFEALRLYVSEELAKIASEVNDMKQGHFVLWSELPDKYSDGDLYFLDANIVEPGSNSGLWFYENGRWELLNEYAPPAATLYSSPPIDITLTDQIPHLIDVFNVIDLQDDITVTLPDTIEIITPGRYQVRGYLGFINPSPNNDYIIRGVKNGVEDIPTQSAVFAKTNGDGVNLTYYVIGDFVQGDTLQLEVIQTAAGVTLLDVFAANFAVIRV